MMRNIPEIANSPLFEGIRADNLEAVLGCVGYHIGSCKKGGIIAFEEEHIRHIGILMSGAVDMIKEDLWGNKTMLVRMHRGELSNAVWVSFAALPR